MSTDSAQANDSASPAGFTGDWITSAHPEYAEAIARWAVNAQRHAQVVAFVRTPADVALALEYAKTHKLPLAVRGGGHSAAGASSAEAGVVIDLSRHIAGVTVDAERKLAHVGGGAVWATVDKAGIEHGLATVGGTVNHRRLTLGGGYGFLTGQHGLALDNLVQATIVTADGTARTVNANENADLFWGVRGGGSNFGVVTEFVLQLHPQRRTVFAGMVIYPAAALSKVVETLKEWWEKGPSEKATILQALTPCTMLLLFWNGSEEEGRAQYKPLFDLGPVMDMSREIPYEELNGLQNHLMPHGRNYYMKGIYTSGPSVPVSEELLQRVAALSAAHGITLFLAFEFFPTGKILTIPNDATAHIRGARVSTLIFSAWDDGDKLPAVRASANELMDVILKGETKLSERENTGYGNYIAEDPAVNAPGAGSTVGADRLFGANYPRLQKLKKQYDPTMLFSKWCPIVPAP
ncbi:FAD-binding domain-containing protein [Auriscalpium vulgare]|uniref:FAD-binding domain-containing protein n=1 Tax=Auriscalpium vulgare TaxID=40419 RepID=A0ACB8S8C6_9AGAM|nr:FAD-binding domain-containing protein [Auriscalpium vulgare]